MRPRFEPLPRAALAQVTGGGANIGGILQAASPLLGMIPGIGPIASAIMPMIGQMTAGAGGGQQPQAPGVAPQGDPQAAAQPSLGSSGGRHRPSVSVSVGTA
ncbi:MAG: hypothetical protein ABI591_04865 [Kofleriaceae bacterium]